MTEPVRTILSDRAAENLRREVAARKQNAAGRSWSEVETLPLPELPDAVQWTEHEYNSHARAPVALVILTQPNHGACVAHLNADGIVYPCRTVAFSPFYDSILRAWMEGAAEDQRPVIDLRGIPST